MEPKSVSKIYTLNKATYINLRWIAILGQFLTVNVAKYVFNFEFDILIVNVVIVLGVISNIILIYFYEKNTLSNRASFLFLLIDILQLSLILYFSGGVLNPFSIFLIIPSVFSSSNLSFKTSLSLILITIFSIILLTLHSKFIGDSFTLGGDTRSDGSKSRSVSTTPQDAGQHSLAASWFPLDEAPSGAQRSDQP